MAQKPWGVWLQRPSSTSALSIEKSPLIRRGYTLRSPVDAWNGKTNEPYIYACESESCSIVSDFIESVEFSRPEH